MLSATQQMDILNLYKGQPIVKAERALVIMESYVAKRETNRLTLRLKIVGLPIG